MRLVTFLARVLACQNLGKALNTDLDTSLYMTWFEIAVSASLFWVKDHESDLSITKTCLVYFSVGSIGWAVTKEMESNNILWKARVLSILEFTISESI